MNNTNLTIHATSPSNIVTSARLEIINFPSGEVGLKSYFQELAAFNLGTIEHIQLKVMGFDKDTLYLIGLAKDMIDQATLKMPVTKQLVLGYLPSARYDRHMVSGDAHALKVTANILNSYNFDEVTLVDPHSDVATGLINNCSVKTQEELFYQTVVTADKSFLNYAGFDFFVAPDLGALKKTIKVAQQYPKQDQKVIALNKTRNLKTGEITGMQIYELEEGDKELLKDASNVILIDDICDGGRTFIEAAKILKGLGCKRVSLYVTHGIFSQGVQHLLDNGIDSIYTTNSFQEWTREKTYKFSDEQFSVRRL